MAVVFFTTSEALADTGDVDTASDVYERDGDGPPRLVSLGALDTNAFFAGASADGSRVFFETREALAGTGDVDTAFDVYERDGDGTLRLVSLGTLNTDAIFDGASADGSRVFFETRETLAGTGDVDAGNDVFVRSLAVPSFASQARVAGTPTVGSALGCVPGEIVGERVTTTIGWLRDGVPIPGVVDVGYVVVGTDVGHGLACRVSVRNPIGSVTQTSGTVVVAGVDRLAPGVRLLVPRCKRKATRNVCRRFRTSVGAWRTLRGIVTDPAPSSGVLRVQVNVVRVGAKQRCAVYNGRRFIALACAKASKRYVRATLSGNGFKLRVVGLRPGSYVVRVRASDRAGNTTPKPAVRKLRLHRP